MMLFGYLFCEGLGLHNEADEYCHGVSILGCWISGFGVL